MPNKVSTNASNTSSENQSRYVKKVAHSIKRIRNSRGLKQSELAGSVGLSTRHFQKIEAGQVDVKTSTARAIADSLSVEPCYLFRVAQRQSLEACGMFCAVEILDMIPIGVQVHNLQGEIYYLNKRRREQLGIPDWRKSDQAIYAWTFVSDPEEAKRLKDYFRDLAVAKPPQPPLADSERSSGFEVRNSVADQWEFIFDGQRRLTGFVALYN